MAHPVRRNSETRNSDLRVISIITSVGFEGAILSLDWFDEIFEDGCRLPDFIVGVDDRRSRRGDGLAFSGGRVISGLGALLGFVEEADCALAAMQKQSSNPSGAIRFMIINRVALAG